MNLLRFLGVFLIPTCTFAQAPDLYAPKKPVSPIYGKWKSKDDEKVVYDFLPNGKVIQYYDGQKMTEERIDTYADCAKLPCTDTAKIKQPHKTAVKRLEKNSCFTLKGNFAANCYKIIRLDHAAFQYAQMGTGNKFSFIRVRADEKPAVVKEKEPATVPAKPKVVQDTVVTKAKVAQDSVKLKMPSKSKSKNKK
jgi:hypothetical protein